MALDRRRFIKNGVALALAALILRTVSVSFGAYVSGRIGAEGMGLYSLIMSVYTLAVTMATSGVQLATTRLVSEALGKGDVGMARAALRTALGYATVCGLGAALLLATLAPLIGRVWLGDVRTLPALRLLSLALLPVALSSVFAGYFTAVRRPSRSAAIGMCEQAARILLTVWLLTALLPRGLGYACLALVGGSAIAEICSALSHFVVFFFDSRRLGRGRAGRRPLRELLDITLPVAAASYVRSGLVSAEHLLIPRALARGGETREVALGAYGVLSGMALPIALYPMAVLSAFAGLLIPEFAESAARGNAAENSRLYERSLVITLAFGMGVGGVMAAFAVPLAARVYGVREAGYYLALLAPIIPVMYLDHVTDVALKGLGRQVFAMAVNIVDSVGSIALVWLLLPRMGAVGYVAVIAIAELFNFAASIAGLRAVLPFRFPLLRGMVYPSAAILTAVTLVQWLLPVAEGVMLVLGILLSAFVYLALLLVLFKLDDRCRGTRRAIDKSKDLGYNRCSIGRAG